MRAISLLFLLFFSRPAIASPPIEAFEDQPTYRHVELSPDGRRVAFVQNTPAGDFLMLFDLEKKSATPPR